MIVKTKIIIIIIAAVACLAVATGVVVMVNYDEWFDPTPPGPEPDPDAGDPVDPEPPPATSQGIAIPGWETITIPANTQRVRVDFPNPVANADKYYLTFKLLLKDTNEVLYQSGLVLPEQSISYITLTRGLSAGTYVAIVHIQPYKMNEEKTPTNNADVQVTLIVK